MHGFRDRLEEARAIRGLTLKQLAAQLKAANAKVRKKAPATSIPHSYRALLNYLAGERTPTAPFMEAAAYVLGVRLEWLRTGKGPMTDTVQAVSTLTAFAPTIVIGRPGAPRAGPSETVARLAEIASPIAGYPAALATFADVWDRFVRSSPVIPGPEQQFKLAEQLWSQVTAPLYFFGVAPEEVDAHYYLTALTALTIAVPGIAKGKNLTRALRKKPHQVTRKGVAPLEPGTIKLGDIFTLGGGKNVKA
jgi:transcriptional regulator with XRE-family HTH domain